MVPQGVQHEHARGRKAKRGCAITFLVWVLSVFLAFWLGSGKLPDGFLGAVAGAAYGVMLILGPAVGVLQSFELIAYLNWRSKKGAGSVAWRLFLGFWLLLFAAVFLIFGAWGVVACAQHLPGSKNFTEGMKGLGGIGLSTGLFAIGLGLVWVTFSRKSEATEEGDIQRANEIQRRWDALDFATLEAHLACTLPSAYKAMMQPGNEWREKDWMLYPNGLDNDDVLYTIIDLDPPDPGAIRQHPVTQETMLCFAHGEYEEYWLKPGTEDPPVYEYSDEEKPVITEITTRLSELLAWPKEEI